MARPQYRSMEQIEAAVERFIHRPDKRISARSIVTDLKRRPADLPKGPPLQPGQHVGDVPTEPFREAFKRSGMSYYQLGAQLGWMYRPGGQKKMVGDGSRARRRLQGKWVRRATAEKLCEALNLDPVDVGL